MYNDEEDLAFKSMVLIRGEEYDATAEIRRIKENLQLHKNDLHALLCTQEGQQPHYRSVSGTHGLRCCFAFLFVTIRHPSQATNRSLVVQPIWRS